MQQRRYRSPCLWTILWAFWTVLSGLVPVGAQSPSYRVAALIPGPTYYPVLQGLQEGLAGWGYHVGNNLTLLVYSIDGDVSNLVDQTAHLVAAKPDLIFTVGTAITAAAKRAAPTIPIVFTYVTEPQKLGIIAGFASSENNVTGISNYAARVSGKRLEILTEIAPQIGRILTLVAIKEPVAEESFQFLQETAQKLAIQVLRRDVTNRAEMEQALQAVSPGSVDAIYHIPSSLVGTNIDLLITKAREDKLPMVVHENSMVGKGALVSYGSDARLTGIQASKLMAQVLHGTKPADLPIQMPEQLHLAINLTTAKAIGLTIPRTVLERVDQLVE